VSVFILRSKGSRVHIQVGSRDISLLRKHPEVTVGPTQFPIQGALGIKRPGRAVDTGSQAAGA
jgi:hypothetical protein